MNKKTVSLLLAVMLVISFLTACGGSGSAPAATAAPTEAPTPAPTEAPTEEPSATDVPAPSNVASGADTIEYEDVTEEGMRTCPLAVRPILEEHRLPSSVTLPPTPEYIKTLIYYSPFIE